MPLLRLLLASFGLVVRAHLVETCLLEMGGIIGSAGSMVSQMGSMVCMVKVGWW